MLFPPQNTNGNINNNLGFITDIDNIIEPINEAMLHPNMDNVMDLILYF